MIAKLTILGTGTFFVNKNRSASAYLLEVDNKKILIDCGPGTLVRLSQIEIKPQDIDFIFITHFHADHTSDLFPLFMNLRIGDNSLRSPQIIGPKGIGKFIIRSSENYELPCVRGWKKIIFTDTKKIQKFGNIKVESFKVKHIAFGLAANSYAYRLTFNNKVIAFSGDSTKCSGIEKVCRNADIFVCDTSNQKGKNDSAHVNTQEIGMIASRSRVKQIILSHLYPRTDNIDLVKEVGEKFSGKVVRGKDLMAILL